MSLLLAGLRRQFEAVSVTDVADGDHMLIIYMSRFPKKNTSSQGRKVGEFLTSPSSSKKEYLMGWNVLENGHLCKSCCIWKPYSSPNVGFHPWWCTARPLLQLSPVPACSWGIFPSASELHVQLDPGQVIDLAIAEHSTLPKKMSFP